MTAPDEPVAPAEFDRLMARFAPFEAAPRLAVAVSGGADSLALALLARDWAERGGGVVTALTVDHRLRPESTIEARQVGAWLRAQRTPHRVLAWRGPRPKANLQAAARAARYDLLTGWCRANGVLHLLLAHQRDDQAETLLLRLGRGSGVDGLAAIAPVTELADVRVLRPLLAIPRERLAATLRARRQPWIDDPSNRNESFARVRLRALMPGLGREGLTVGRLAATAGRLARARLALDTWTTRLCAAAVTIDPSGYAVIDREALGRAPEEIGLRLLAAVLRTIGGGVYPPRLARLERLYRAIVDAGLPAARTLGGCRVLRLGARAPEVLLICRELAVAGPVPLRPGLAATWDGRFTVRLARRPPGARGALRLGGLGAAGWRSLVAADPSLRSCPIPAAVRPTLPTVFDLDGPLLVPHLTYGRGNIEPDSVNFRHLAFRPARPLAIGPLAVP